MRLISRRLVLVVAVALLTTSNPYAAATYREKAFRCAQSLTTGGSVTVNWPSLTSVSGGAEAVYFLPMLYRWQNGEWQPYLYLPGTAQSAPSTWCAGVADSGGPVNQGTIDRPQYFAAGGSWASEPFFQVPAGHYAVLEYYSWANGMIASTWATYQSGNTWAFYQPTAYTYYTIV